MRRPTFQTTNLHGCQNKTVAVDPFHGYLNALIATSIRGDNRKLCFITGQQLPLIKNLYIAFICDNPCLVGVNLYIFSIVNLYLFYL